MTPSTPRRRHKWDGSEAGGGESCGRCGLVRWYVPGYGERGLGAVYNYQWPDGRQDSRKVNSGYVPPCGGNS
jgi:hypothetical protein